MFCTRCGFLNAAGAQYCASCGSALTTPPAIQPGAPAEGGTPPPSPPSPSAPLARLSDRFLATVLDSILLVAVFALSGMWAASRWGGFTERGFSLEGMPALVATGIGLGFALLYYWLMEGLFGATLGKAIIGIAVRRSDGSPCSLRPSLIRNLVRVVDAIGIYLVGFLTAVLSRSRQRLGDMAAKTIVIERPLGGAARVSVVLLWLAAVAAGLAGAILLHRQPAATPGEVTASAGVPGAARGDLRLINVAFLEREDGPPRQQAPYLRRELVYLKYDIVGFGAGPEGKVDLLISGAVTDPNGLTLHSWSRDFNQQVGAGNPVNGWVSTELPGFAPPGRYRIEINVEDKVKNARISRVIFFEVQGEPVAPASRLEIRDFELALSKEGPALRPLVLEGGGTVYMRWKIAGLEFRGEEMDVRVALKVYGPSGRLLLDEPSYVSERESISYRPPGFFLPVSGHLNVPAGFDKGTYTARFEAVDNVAQAKAEWTGKFEVR